MCELLGLCFNQPVQPRISFRAFRRRGEDNPHGWGLAFYPGKSALILKEPLESVVSALSTFVQEYPYIKSKIFIAHVRRTSIGSISYDNTHPFSRELNGKEYVFAHNGTLRNFRRLKLGRFKPLGKTDSEHVFCYLLSEIEERGIENWTEDDFEWLHEKFREINTYGTFNCLMSDGEYLFAYHDIDGYNGLHYVRREAPFGSIILRDEDYEIDLAEEKDPSQRGYIIATQPLTNEEWQSFSPGELIVFKDGEIVYPLDKGLSKLEIEILRVVRESPHRVSLRAIIDSLSCDESEIKSAIKSLLKKRYLRQDRRDRVPWNNYEATFFTEPRKRDIIDRILRSL